MWENVCGIMYVGRCKYVGAQTSNAWQYLHFSPYIRTFFTYIRTFFTYLYILFLHIDTYIFTSYIRYIHLSHTFLHIHTFSHNHFPTYIFPHAYIFSHTFPHIHFPTYIHFLYIHFPHTNVCM